MSGSSHWLQLTADGSDCDRIEQSMLDAGAVSVTLRPADSETLLEPGPGDTPMWANVRVSGLFPANLDGKLIELALRNELPDILSGLHAELIEDREWLEVWKQELTPQRFGEHLWVIPEGHREMPAENAICVELDPGMAFGTGKHPTTALCLRWLDHLAPRGQSVIDYGCGSGILAIAAARLGAAHVRAVDHDPQAITATQQNARRNGVEQAIHASLPDAMHEGLTECLVANILLNPLLELAPRFAELVRPGCDLLLTGLLKSQHEAIVARYSQWFDLQPPLQADEWIAVAGWRKPI